MRFRTSAIILAAAFAVVGGAQLRIAKIVIKERGGPRTVFRICLPGRTPDVLAMTDRDFMCRIYDRYGFRELDGGFGRATETIVTPPPDAPPVLPDERDRQVLETVLLQLLADPEFDMTRAATNGAVIVLHSRTPEKTGFLMSHQIRSDIGGHTLPSEVEEDLRRRNTPPNAKADTYDAITAFYTNLTFGVRIVVADLSDKTGGPRSYSAFEEAHPKARGFVLSYLPGYSKDGTRVVVRAGVGPSPHGAMVTVLLEKRDDKWVVKWHHIARYA